MARIVDNAISGAIGTFVFYTLNGEKFIRAKPEKMKKKRSAAVRRSNTVFGTISTYGSAMIGRMSKSFLFPFGLNTYNRIRVWMRNQYELHHDEPQWELTAANNMCQANPEADLRDLFMPNITATDNTNGQFIITIPAMNPMHAVRAPFRTSRINIKCVAVTSSFEKRDGWVKFCMEEYKFNHTDNDIPAKEIMLDTKAKTGDIAIVVIALEYEMIGEMYNREKRWLPVGVLAMGRVE